MYRVKHRKSYRTRVCFPILKGQGAVCRQIQLRLQEAKGADAVLVRSTSGSVIVEHVAGPLPLAFICEEVYAVLEEKQGGNSDLSLGVKKSCCERNKGKRVCRNHVSGTALALTGLYLCYLAIKRFGRAVLFSTTTTTTPIISLPSLLAIYFSLPIQRQAVEKLKKTGQPDMGLISIGMLYVTIAMGNGVAALTVFWLFNLSNWLEARIQGKTRRAVREMLTGKLSSVWLVRDGVEIEVDSTDLVPGDIITLRTGNSVPVDGTVIHGRAIINESILTGEELPVVKQEGNTLFTGTFLEEGDVQLRVTHTGESTRLAAILKLIENAEQDMGELQRTSQNISRKLVPFSLSLAGATLLLTGNPVMAMTVLIITCPCALRLSTSVTVSAAMSNAAISGIFIKGGRYVEIAGKVNVLVVDKTGTITDPVAEVRAIKVLDDNYSQEELLQFAASVQKSCQHPLGRAVISEAKALGINRLCCEEAQMIPGRGIEAAVGTSQVLVGNKQLLEEHRVQVDMALHAGEQPCSHGMGNLYIAVNGILVGIIETGSIIKRNMDTLVDQLKAIGIKRVVLLTGDGESGVMGIREQMQFDEILCEQSPENKAEWISRWKKQHPEDVVAMFGDGINDTPAFAAADLSLSVGRGGADVAVEYADIVLQDGHAHQLVAVFSTGQHAVRVIQVNHLLAIGLNSLALGCMLAGIVSPIGGALLHNLITVAAVSNGAAMLSYKSTVPKVCTLK